MPEIDLPSLSLGNTKILKDVYSSMSSSDVDSGLNTGSKADLKEVEENKRPK